MPVKHHSGSRGQPELSRKAILEAALDEFATQGVAGARIDAIAAAARVNKALLYYYFRNKEGLYGAALDHVFEPLIERLAEVLERPLPASEKVLTYAGTHFDFIASHPIYPRLMMHELMRAGGDRSPHLDRIVARYFRPVSQKLAAVLDEGAREGVFRELVPQQVILSMVAIIVFYFSSTPMLRAFGNVDPLNPAMLCQRRAAVLDFLSGAIFRDATEARRVLARMQATKSGPTSAQVVPALTATRGKRK